MKRFINFTAMMTCILIAFPSCTQESAPEVFPVNVGERWGYINAKGEYIVNPSLDDAYPFSCGLAKIKRNGKVGYISPKGKEVIPSIYHDGTSFVEDKSFVVKVAEAPVCINKSGKKLFTVDEAEIIYAYSDGMARFKTNNQLFGFIDKKGTSIIEPKFSYVEDFHEGLAVYEQGKKYGYINKEGNTVIEARFDKASSFSESLAAVKVGNLYGYINEKGETVINPQFDQASGFSEGLAMVAVGDNCGFINKKGIYEINPQFEIAGNFSSGLAQCIYESSTSSTEWMGYIDRTGKIAINPTFLVGTAFTGNYAFAYDGSTKKAGLIDKKGTYVVKPQFDEVYFFGDSHKDFITSNCYRADDLLNNFRKKYNNDISSGYSIRTTLGEIKGKISVSKGPNDSTVTHIIKRPELVNGAGVDKVTYYFDRKTFKLVDNYVWGFFGSYKDGKKREYLTDPELRDIEYHFTLEGNAHKKGASLAQSLAQMIDSSFSLVKPVKEEDSFMILSDDRHHSYSISYTMEDVTIKVCL